MNRPPSLLEINELSKSFGGLRVIEDLTFEVPRGGRHALIGPNGAGKTTVFNLISGVYPVTKGTIRIDGRDVTTMRSRRRIGYGLSRSFQNVRLIAYLTALENVMLGQHHRGRRISSLIAPVGLMRRNRWHEEARAALADAGLEDYTDELVSTLPYGVQKRIELVRALLAAPKLLLLDEPAAGLNPTERNQLQDFLVQASDRGITLLVVEHDMRFIGDLCDHVVVLNFGRKIAEGTPAEVRRHWEVREAYLGTDDVKGISNHVA